MTPRASEAPGAGSLATVEKGGATFEGLRLLLCENPLPPLDEAIADARLGPGFMRVTTALPEQNAQVLDVLRELLATDP